MGKGVVIGMGVTLSDNFFLIKLQFLIHIWSIFFENFVFNLEKYEYKL